MRMSKEKQLSKMIQIRHVPADLHRKLKARAALAGMSLSDYLLNGIRQMAERPTLEEMMKRLASRERVEIGDSAVNIIREERDRL